MKYTDSVVRPIGKHEPFNFSCGPHVPCFNECCRDLNQFLMPYDVLRLARHMKTGTREFLNKWTLSHTGPETGLPVVTLRPAEDGGKCPFVSCQGCRVYDNRPSSCRMYPLARMLKRSRQDARIDESYALICEEHCRGFEQSRAVTPLQWIAEQGLECYNELNDALIEVISAKQSRLPGPLDKETAERLFFALYDIDSFIRDLAGTTGEECENLGLCPDKADAGNDESLVRFAVKYAACLLRHKAEKAGTSWN
ncbi:MAG: YkgJ family cysteine cluster protein [Desulfobacteraceae bacterium]|nr:YkgJ family cysteine cluster protein [Desulfobacteraceae bacterium]